MADKKIKLIKITEEERKMNILRKFRWDAAQQILFSSLVLLMLDEGVVWEFPFGAATLADRVGMLPELHHNLGFPFRLLTLFAGLYPLVPAVFPRKKNAKFIMTALLCNSYSIVELALNILENCLALYELEVDPMVFVRFVMMGAMVVIWHFRIIIRMLCFHKFISALEP